MFLLNSRLSRLSAASYSTTCKKWYHKRHPFFRSYGIIMPSSLTLFHSFTLGYSPYPPVSVYGTDAHLNSQLKLFLPVDSRKLGIGLPRILALPSRISPTRLDGQSTRPLPLRYRVPSVVITLKRRGRNVRLLSIDYASGASP